MAIFCGGVKHIPKLQIEMGLLEKDLKIHSHNHKTVSQTIHCSFGTFASLLIGASVFDIDADTNS